MEAASKARSAEKRSDNNSEAVLEGVTPAVEGLQEALSQAQDWSKEVTTELEAIHKKMASLEHDVAYLRGYVDYDSRGRYRPKTPTVSLDKTKPDLPEPLTKKPSVKIPNNVQDAREQLKAAR